MSEPELESLAAEMRGCRICVERPLGKPLPHDPRPVFVLSRTARMCICGQAPGTRVHASGRPFTDPSGDRLRGWMGISDEIFYDPGKLAIVPMGFCFPGLDAKGGDLPPRKECRQQWHARVFAAMPQLELIVLVGRYAQKWHLPGHAKSSLTATVADWRAIYTQSERPRYIPTPHPSWRNNAWIKRNPWFSSDLLPVLRSEVTRLADL